MRDRCTENDCRQYALFADPARIKANMREHVYDATIGRYALAWAAAGPATGSGMAGLAPSSVGSTTLSAFNPSSKPIDFPNAASIPPVNIMAAEPSSQSAAPAAPKPPAAANAQAAKPAPAKKQTAAAPKPKAAAAPTSLAPASSDDN
jgi:hypothetical protein